jgi:hypothetical protein
MNFENALASFVRMDCDQKFRVMRVFELTRYSPAFTNLDDAFAGAVADESYAIDRQRLFKSAAEEPAS